LCGRPFTEAPAFFATIASTGRRFASMRKWVVLQNLFRDVPGNAQDGFITGVAFCQVGNQGVLVIASLSPESALSSPKHR
jgi:hypothetical protein